jgi:hypothetical protein
VTEGWTVHEAAERERRRLRVPVAVASAATIPSSVTRPAPAVAVAVNGSTRRAAPAPAARSGRSREKLSKDAYRRQKIAVDAELTRLGLRKTQLELSMGSPAISANFVEMRRVASELADVEQALASAEDAWLEIEERAP